MGLSSRLAKYNKLVSHVFVHETVPCYMERLCTPLWVTTEEQIFDVIDGVMEDRHHGVLLISVTSKEPHHQLWIDSIMNNYEEATLVKGNSRHQGGYDVWCMMIPMHD